MGQPETSIEAKGKKEVESTEPYKVKNGKGI